MDSTKNILAFHERLNGYRKNEQYCDLHFEVRGKTFHCHRQAFMMESESCASWLNANCDLKGVVNVPEVDPKVFEEIEKFVYTGTMMIDRDNICEIYFTSLRCHLASVEEHCVNYIKENLPLSHMFQTLTFARAMGRQEMVDLLSRYSMSHFNEVCDDPNFLKLSVEDLKILQSQQFYLSVDNEEIFLDAIRRWADWTHDSEYRHRQFEELLEEMDFKQITPNYVKFLLRKTLTTSNEDDVKPVHAYKRQRVSSTESEIVNNLCMCVESVKEKEFGIYTAGKKAPQWTPLASKPGKFDSISIVEIDGKFYSLTYSNEPGPQKQFQVHGSIYSVLSTGGCHLLKQMPVKMRARYMSLAKVDNFIYISNSSPLMEEPKRLPYSKILPDEEIQQGIFGYNMDIDEWFGTPSFRQKPLFSSRPVTSDGRVLYAVCQTDEPYIRLLAWDKRSPDWVKLGWIGTPVANNTSLRCCFHKERIYVCGVQAELKQRAVVLSYDLEAARWEPTSPTNVNHKNHQFLSYENWLWAFGLLETGFFNCEVYNPYTEKWSPSPISGDVFQEGNEDRTVFRNTFVSKVIT